MNARDYKGFTRARSASPKTHRVLRSKIRLKPTNVGPSPTSVMTQSFNFDEAPFDCPNRASSVGNSSKTNYAHLNTFTGNGSGNVNSGISKIDTNVYPQQYNLRVPPSSVSPPVLEKSPTRKSLKCSIPKSPKSTNNRGSSFRQRRLLLAQQRKWKEEMMEKTVQSKTSNEKVAPKSTLGGKERIVNSADGLEISISSHLEKEGFDHSLLSTGHDQNQFPAQSANVNTVHPDDYSVGDASFETHGYSREEFADPELDAMTIDTVSSLNTMQSEFSVKSWLPQKLKSPNSSGRQRKKLQTSQNKSVDRSNSMHDELHPPMYVQSKVRLSKESLQVNNDSMEPSVADEPKLSRIGDLGIYQSSVTHLRAHESKLEVTEVVSNKTGLTTQNRMRNEDDSVYDDDNDIPAIQSCAGKSDRASPTSQFSVGNDEVGSIRDEISTIALRRRRLQQTYLIRSNKPKSEDKNSSDSEQCKDMRYGNDSLGRVEYVSQTKIIEVVKMPDLPISEQKPSHFDESEEKPSDGYYDHCNNDEDKIESDLQILADKRDYEEDEQSIMTSRSVQTCATLKTCFTTKPATKEAMEASIKKKQHRVNMIHHALSCTHPHPTKVDDENYTPCPEVKHCHALGVLVKHVQTCTSIDPVTGGSCEVPNCAAYRKVWNHYRRCVLRTFTKSQKKECRICQEVWRKYAFDVEPAECLSCEE